MTLAATLIDDTYSANNADGRKRVYFTISLTNPYTAGGDSFDISAYFKTKLLGFGVSTIAGAVTAALAGVASTGRLRGDASSIATTAALTPKMQFFQPGLSGTASAGLWVDNTTANLSNTTFNVWAEGY